MKNGWYRSGTDWWEWRGGKFRDHILPVQGGIQFSCLDLSPDEREKFKNDLRKATQQIGLFTVLDEGPISVDEVLRRLAGGEEEEE